MFASLTGRAKNSDELFGLANIIIFIRLSSDMALPFCKSILEGNQA